MPIDLVQNPDYRAIMSIVQSYQECQSCGIVDQDGSRVVFGTRCSHCETVGNGGFMFFSLEIQMVVELVAESWLERAPAPINRKSDLSLIIFYCTLQEMLLEEFLTSCMSKDNVSEDLMTKILNDNKSITRRIDSLFPALTKKAFRDAVYEIIENKDDAKNILDTWNAATDARNHFVHKGYQWGIPTNLVEACWKTVPILCRLFADLQNRYIVAKD